MRIGRSVQGRRDGAEHAQVVVVGSGFGGSVAAYRLASAGQEVVVLERGKPHPPGSFPRTPSQLGRAFWDPSEGLHGMFDVWTFRGIEGVVSSGLGGGSLIYANVLLRKDEKWFTTASPVPGGGYEHWPVTREDLDPHYGAVEQMLGAARYPYADSTPKTVELRGAAERLGLDWQLPPLAVSFASRRGADPVPGAPLDPAPYGNLHGLPRRTCRLCGECDLGCNDGAKNTLDHTYLSAAAHAGADLRTRCEVRGLAPREGGGYVVRYVVHEPDAEGRRTDTAGLVERTLSCDRLVLAAGTFGTSYLLLRNRAAFPGLSSALGTRFCGNGDLLTFVLGARGEDGRPRTLDGSRGPVITSAVRVGDELDGDGATGRGFYVQDAGYPGFSEWLVEATQIGGALRRGARFAGRRLRHRLLGGARSGMSADLAALIGSGRMSSTSLPLLGMGRDVPDGVMRLRRGQLDIDWTTTTSASYFGRVRDTMAALAGEMRGELMDNPLWWTRRVVTVHPLGGVPMGRSARDGVADGFGEVFGFPGLHVLDGSLLPGPVGANPSLTIAAVADRACTRILETAALPAQRSPIRLPVDPPPPAVRGPHATSLSFTEQMKGFVALDAADPAEGERLGRQLGQRLMFRLTITAPDVDAFVHDPEHLGTAEGYVECDLLGGRLPVERGWFNLFVAGDDARQRRMLYRLWFRDAGGNALTFTGEKDVVDDAGLDVWRDTSTLSVRILAGHVLPPQDAAARSVAAGVITIRVPDFLQQLTTFRTEGPDGAGAMASFGRLFLGELWEVYGSRIGEPVA